MSKAIALIPSRLESSRVQRKPLVDIVGLPMIVHVYKRACLSAAVDEVCVATDSEQIVQTVEAHGGKAVLTGSHHRNGTERLAEAAQDLEYEFVVLVNGDEALLNPDYIAVSLDALVHSGADASILVNKYFDKSRPSDFKVVLNRHDEVMYISRGDIPSDARNTVDYRLKAYHIMAFRREFLGVYANLDPTPLERIEDHEHLRVIENGYKLQAALVESSAVSVDTPEDLDFVRSKMPEDIFYQHYR